MTTEIGKSFKPSFKELNTASPPKPDVVFTKKESNDTEFQTFTMPSILPNSEKEDYLLKIRASVIADVRGYAAEVNKEKNNYAEVILSLGMVCLGAIFNDYDSKYIHSLLACVAGACAVGYYFTRKLNTNIRSEFANKVLKLLPNEKENKPNGY